MLQLSSHNFASAEPASISFHGIGPWTSRNTKLANGPDFKRGAVIRTPTSNVDVTPTLLYLLGLDAALAGMDGRPLTEALAGGPDSEQVPMEVRALSVSNGSYRAVLQESSVGGKRYIDKASREFGSSTAGVLSR